MPTILCIDDDLETVRARVLLLESQGYQVIQAKTGEEGLQLLRTLPMDLVVIDYWMSGMNGRAVAEQIRKWKPKLPIIMLSGFGELMGESLGIVDCWLLKGRPAQEFLDAVRALLNSSTGGESASERAES